MDANHKQIVVALATPWCGLGTMPREILPVGKAADEAPSSAPVWSGPRRGHPWPDEQWWTAELVGQGLGRSKIKRLETRRSGVEACDGLIDAGTCEELSHAHVYQEHPWQNRQWPWQLLRSQPASVLSHWVLVYLLSKVSPPRAHLLFTQPEYLSKLDNWPQIL